MADLTKDETQEEPPPPKDVPLPVNITFRHRCDFNSFGFLFHYCSVNINKDSSMNSYSLVEHSTSFFSIAEMAVPLGA